MIGRSGEIGSGISVLASRHDDDDDDDQVGSVRLRPGRPGFNPMSRYTKDSKMVLDAALLNTQHYKARFKSKVVQSKERSSTLP